MEKNKGNKGFKEVKKVATLPVRQGKEIRFSVVSLDGQKHGDIRYFFKSKREDVWFPSEHGFTVTAEKIDDFLHYVEALADVLKAGGDFNHIGKREVNRPDGVS